MMINPKFINTIILCDCVVGMAGMPDACIPFTMASPPYDHIRKYGGQRFDFEATALQLYRITMEGGVVVWIVRDAIVNGGESGTIARQQLYFLDLGFRLHATMVMKTKRTGLPQQVRYPTQFEYAFVFSKGRPRTINLIRDRRNSTAGQRHKIHRERDDGRRETVGYHPFKVVGKYGLRGNVWEYDVGGGKSTTDEFAFGHPALMHEQMAEDHILSWSRPGDLVFDPMCGSGTTCKMALLNNRRYLGFEIHGPYFQIAQKRMRRAHEQHRRDLDEYFEMPYRPPTPAIRYGKKSSRGTSIETADVPEVLSTIADDTFDAVLSDPPYGLGFMAQAWDGTLPPVSVWQELLRVCKPGAWLLGFGGARTYHRLACHIEDAGWLIKDCLLWIYGQGLPKSFNISKAIDRKLGAKGKAIGTKTQRNGASGIGYNRFRDHARTRGKISLPGSPEAQQWSGYRTALKPAYEPIVLAMTPLNGTYADNALNHGVGGLNIDGCRIDCAAEDHDERRTSALITSAPEGRFPSNLMFDDEAARMLDRCNPHSKGGKRRRSGRRDLKHKGNQLYGGGIGGGEQQAPDNYGDAGGPSRFFYCPKANKKERNHGLPAGQKNAHTCVKPIALCEYLARLILPPEREDIRRLLVPYAGTGSEMIGAMAAGWETIFGIERDAESVRIAEARIEAWKKGTE
ncbi:MAG: site-specific DNA-methyltransferase [Candidatus Nealsonbacteria bacterium]|nr:site-specific DNA-methyltransferase [Candidatus Nealsonbacteria bacterium]